MSGAIGIKLVQIEYLAREEYKKIIREELKCTIHMCEEMPTYI